MRRKIVERVQRVRDSLFLDKTAGLKKMPFAVCGKLAIAKRKFCERNAGADDVDLVFVAAELEHTAFQRFCADKNSSGKFEHLFGCRAISRFVHVHQHIRSMKGNDTWLLPP